MKKYKEPEVQFISLNPSEKIANPCWAFAVNNGDSPKYYYDLEGPGYLSFKIAKRDNKGIILYGNGNGNGCNSAKPCEVFYYYDSNGDSILENNEITSATDEQINQLIWAMHTEFGGESGEPTQASHFPGNPGNWS